MSITSPERFSRYSSRNIIEVIKHILSKQSEFSITVILGLKMNDLGKQFCTFTTKRVVNQKIFLAIPGVSGLVLKEEDHLS
jgi:hypothetical protein